MKAGIEITGKDYGCCGCTEDEIDMAIMDRLGFIEEYGLVGGGAILGIPDNLQVDFTCELENEPSLLVSREGEELFRTWLRFCAAYRHRFPTFDGHIKVVDVDHVDRDGQASIDKFMNPPT